MILDQSTTTLIGAFGGVLLGHYLSRSWQREQWRLDRRTDEYKELLCALSTVFTNKQRFSSGGGDKDFDIKLELANVESLRVIRDRIIIAPELVEADILTRWYVALDYADRSGGHPDWKKFADSYTELTSTLVKMALSPPPSRWRRMSKKAGRSIKAFFRRPFKNVTKK